MLVIFIKSWHRISRYGWIWFQFQWRSVMDDITMVQKDKLMSDLHTVISDAGEVLRMTADEAGESAADLRGRVQARMNQAKDELRHLQETAVATAKAAGHAADDFVHDNPWKSIGIATGIGLVVGLLISRR